MDTYDIHIAPVIPNAVTGMRCFTFGYKAAVKVTGFQSLINRWVRTLLTPLGSDYLYPDRGTPLGGLIGNNVSSLSTELQDLVFLSVVETNAQVKQQDRLSIYPAKSQLYQATISQYIELPSSIEVWVRIENMLKQQADVRAVSLMRGER